jgi:hypothetical protein
MVEMGRLVSRVSREFLDDPDQWEPQETKDQWETRDLRDNLEFQDLQGPEEILVKMDLQECPDHRVSLDLQEREEWLGLPAPGASRGCQGRPVKMGSQAGTEQLACRDLQA